MSRIVPFKLNTFEGVQAGERAYTKLPNGPTYQEIVLVTNLEAAEIKKVSTHLGGVHQVGEIVEVTGEELAMFEAYKGNHQDANVFVIPFGAMEARTDVGMMFSGLVTLPSDNIMLYVELADVVAAETPSIEGWAYASASQTERNVIPMIKPHTIVTNAAGDVDYTNLPQDAKVRRLHFKGDLTRVLIKKDGADRFEQSDVVNDFQLQRHKRTPQAGYFHVDFVKEGYVAADLFEPRAVNDLTIRMTTASAGNVRMLVESVKVLGNSQA